MQRKSKIFTMVIALLVSVALWFYVVTVENPETEATITGIPVTFSGMEELNEDRDLIITSGLDTTVSLRLSGKRSEISKLTADNITLTVDLTRVTRAQTYTLNYDISYPADVSTSAIQVDTRYPSNVTLTVENIATKQVQVRGELVGGTADGFTTESMSFDYDEITIRGPEAVVNQVSYALVTLERTNLEKTVTTTLPYTLMTADGEAVDSSEITSDVTEIELTLPVVQFKQVPLSVDFIAGGGATEKDVVYKITPESVTVSGDASALDMVNQINLGNIDLGNVISSGTYEFNILLPNSVKSISGEEVASVTVEVRGLETKTLRISTVEFAQVPEGFTATAITQMQQITVRASSDDIDNITASNVHAVADLTGISANAGTYTVPLTIEIYGYPDAGVIGSYNAVVSLEELTVADILGGEDG